MKALPPRNTCWETAGRNWPSTEVMGASSASSGMWQLWQLWVVR